MVRIYITLALLSLTAYAFSAPAPKPVVAETVSPATSLLPRHEIQISASEGLFSFGNGFRFGLNGAYHYAITRPLQVGGTLGFGVVDQGPATRTALLALVGPTLNLPFEGSLNSAFFLSGQAGLLWYTGGGSFERFAFALDFGKRFEVFPGVIYKPFLRVGRLEVNPDADSTEASMPIRFYLYVLSASVTF